MKTRFVRGQLYLVDGLYLERAQNCADLELLPEHTTGGDRLVIEVQSLCASAEPWGGPPDPTPEELAELFPEYRD